MNSGEPPVTPDESPERPSRPGPKDPRPGLVAFRAALGFLTYLLVGGISLSMTRGSPVFIVLLVGLAIVLALTRTWRGFALGVFIGVGLTLLLIGACFAMVASR
jgi:hypothetical protein